MRTLILLLAGIGAALAVTPPDQLKVPAGFKVELLREAGPSEGSWICMAIDDAGRLYISSQDKTPESGFTKDSKWGGMWRATIGTKGTDVANGAGKILNPKSEILNWEKVPVPVGDAMGMLWAFDSLYVSGNGPEGRGIYRCKDTDGDGHLDSAAFFKAIPDGSGEHGAHAIILGPDKKLYIVHGNTTPILAGLSPDSPYRNWGEDNLLPRVNDPVATFFDKIKPPYGCVYRTDENGTKWELFAGGFRNPYDIAFNTDGELFTYDSDMEWDRGLPWYRPTRVLHVVPGGEYGFREGSAKWPPWQPDSLPAVCDIGVGCPTGIKFGTGARGWPETYQRALFIIDWTYGRILAVHLHEKGASYTARNDIKSYTYPKEAEANHDVEVFLSGKGMPMTDLEFGKDGALYFTTGGRGTSAALYRVSWDKKTAKSENESLGKGGALGSAGVPPAVPGVSPGTPNVASAASRESATPRATGLAGERTTTFDASRETRDAAGGTPALPARPPLANADANRGTAPSADPRASDAPEARRKLAGGAASEASATTGSASARVSAPEGAQENAASEQAEAKRLRSAVAKVAHARLTQSIPGDEWNLYLDAVSKWADRGDNFALHWSRVETEEKLAQLEPENARKTTAAILADAQKVPAVVKKELHSKFQQLALPPVLEAARITSPDLQGEILEVLKAYSFDSLAADALKLLKLRILELSFARQGRPSAEAVKALVEELSRQYPAKSEAPRGAPSVPAATKTNGEAALQNGAVKSGAPSQSGAARGSDVAGETRGAPLGGAPMDDPSWRLNRELSQLLIWLTNPELGELNSELAKTARSDGLRPSREGTGTAGSHPSLQAAVAANAASTPVVAASGQTSANIAADPKPETRNPATAAPAGDQPASSRRQLLGPVPNPGASVFPGREDDDALAAAGREVIEKTLALMDAASSQEEQIWYALCLRWAHGWTPEQRARYFRWFHEKAGGYTGGNSFSGFVNKIRTEALAHCTEAERAALGHLASAPTAKALVELKPRAFVQAWTMGDLEPSLGDVAKGRNFARGSELFGQAQCILCHKMGVTGGNVGPDLTAVASRFPRKDVLTAILDPSKDVSDQYAMMTFTVRRGEKLQEVSGLVQEDTGGTFTVLTDALSGKTEAFYHHVVVKKEKALVSIMPPGLLNTLTKEEVLDLLAYLESGGKPDAANFK